MNRWDEEFYFQYFIKNCKSLSLRNFAKSESPDFISNDDLMPVIGVELTEIVTKRKYLKNPKIKLYSLAEQISNKACDVFVEKYQVPLNVGIYFYENLDVPKAQIDKLANDISEVVHNYIAANNFNECFHIDIEENLPECIREISVSFYPKVHQPVWYYPYTEFVPNLNREEIADCIRKKESLIKKYRQKADKIYLVIIEGRLPNWHDRIDDAISQVYDSSFDKVFLFRSVEKEIYHIKTNN